jgi:hypothetical protein
LSGLSDEVRKTFSTELVIDEAPESDRISDGLQRCDGVTEDNHGRNDEEDIFEDAGQRENQGGCFSDLRGKNKKKQQSAIKRVREKRFN